VQLVQEAMPNSSALMPSSVRNVKIRTFTPPGAMLELEAELLEADGERVQLKVGARSGGKSIGGGRIEVAPRMVTA
jgi:predicted thioesterase